MFGACLRHPALLAPRLRRSPNPHAVSAHAGNDPSRGRLAEAVGGRTRSRADALLRVRRFACLSAPPPPDVTATLARSQAARGLARRARG